MPGRPRKLCKCEKREESPELGRQEALWGEGEEADSRTTAAGPAVRVSLSRRQAEEWDVTWQEPSPSYFLQADEDGIFLAW